MSAFSGYGASKAQVSELFEILSIMRPHESGMEEKFINHYLGPLGPEIDKCGNLFVRIGTAPVLWSCHVDTVHSFGGIAPLKLHDDGLIKVHPKSRANCLGADDGAGVWLMLQMIRAQRPGLYVFHRGEERGGIGSRWVAKNTPGVLEGIECAIAFDRKDTGSIITHQWGGRCCSEDFSSSLAKSIGLGMKSDTTGSFTDTASYTDLIGECTNVSVGYKFQHGKTEEQDLMFLLTLMDRMLEVDTKDLVYKRRPGDKEKKSYGRSNWGSWAGGNVAGHDADDYGDYYSGAANRASYAYDPKYKYEQGKIWSQQAQGYVWAESSGRVWDEDSKKWVMKAAQNQEKGVRSYMDTNTRWRVARNIDEKIVVDNHLALVRDFPEQIAAILADKAYGIGYLHEQIRKQGGKDATGKEVKLITAYLPAEGEAKHDKKNGKADDGPTCKVCYRMHQYCVC